MKYWLSVISTIVLIGIFLGLNGTDDKKGGMTVIEQQLMELMKTLDTLDERSRMKLLSQIDQQRNELLGVLLKHLGSSESKNVQAAAIYLIGRHRLSHGAEALTKRIDFDAGGPPRRGPEPLWEQYPAMEALINIGRPAVPAALELLAVEKDDLRRDLAVKVIRYVEDAGISKFILERAYSSELDSARKANLGDALVRLDKLPR